MKRWSWHRTRALFLALLLAARMSLSFIEASVMSAKMAISAEMAEPGSNGCHSCDRYDGGIDLGS